MTSESPRQAIWSVPSPEHERIRYENEQQSQRTHQIQNALKYVKVVKANMY